MEGYGCLHFAPLPVCDNFVVQRNWCGMLLVSRRPVPGRFVFLWTRLAASNVSRFVLVLGNYVSLVLGKVTLVRSGGGGV